MFQCPDAPDRNYSGLNRGALTMVREDMKRPKARGRQRAKSASSATERREKREPVIDQDALLKEVGKANEHITNPDERERVIPSRPC